MNVCFITANYPPEARGGTEQVVVALAQELVRGGRNGPGTTVSVITGSDVVRTGDDLQHELHDGIAVTRVFRTHDEQDRNGFVRPRVLALVRARLLELQPDVVHVHSFAGLSLGIASMCRELQIPLVVTFHDLWVTCARYFRLPAGGVTCPTDRDRSPCVVCVNDALRMDREVLKQALLQRDELVRREVAVAAACTAPSQTAADLVRQCLPYDGAIAVLPHGLLQAVPFEHAAVPVAAGVPVRIGTFGGLVAAKGIAELLQACVALHQSGVACELHLAGKWHDPQFATAMRTLAQQGGLTLQEHGSYAPNDRHPARDLDLAVFPSKCQETYGLVVDEALAHRVPVVVSNFGALAERNTTGVVVVTALKDLTAVLHELVASPERLATLRAAIPQQLPTIQASARRHLDLYQGLR